MTPIEFKGFNVIFGKGQEEYNPLPAHVESTGIVTTAWQMTDEERAEFEKTGVIYLQMYTFGAPLQPVLLSVSNPFDLLG
jgi:hypothetical protein